MSYAKRESFIPFTREEIVKICLEDGRLREEQIPEFKRFCDILTAYVHHQYHARLETMKRDFDPFNPDDPSLPSESASEEDCKAMQQELAEVFEDMLRRANYSRITEEELEKAFAEDALIKLNTHVDFDDFDQMVLYARGRTPMTTTRRFLRFFRRRHQIDVYERVAVLLKFKDEAHFRAKKMDVEAMNFRPGKMYLYLYKNIPRYDAEVLFPNLLTRMSLRDKLFIGVPAIAGLGSILVRSLAQLAIIVGFVLIVFFGEEAAKGQWGVDKDFDANDFYRVAAATLSLIIAFGILGFRQWNSYRTKQLRFQKLISETLFFKNIATNRSVFHYITDQAEEEACKQMILVYYHLRTAMGPLTAEQLDNQIEQWFKKKYDIKIDFDVDYAMECLSEIRGRTEPGGTPRPLLECDVDGVCHTVTLQEANRLIDDLWDNIFPWANEV